MYLVPCSLLSTIFILLNVWYLDILCFFCLPPFPTMHLLVRILSSTSGLSSSFSFFYGEQKCSLLTTFSSISSIDILLIRRIVFNPSLHVYFKVWKFSPHLPLILSTFLHRVRLRPTQIFGYYYFILFPLLVPHMTIHTKWSYIFFSLE